MEHLNIFNKKSWNIKEKVKEYIELEKKFKFWEFNVQNNEINNKDYVFWLMTSGIFLTPVCFVLYGLGVFDSGFKACILHSILSILNTFLITNLKFGYFKNRYKKILKVREEIKEFFDDSSNIYAIVNENEKKVKELVNKLEEEELKESLIEKTKSIVDEIKNNWANCDKSKISQLSEVLNKNESYEKELAQFIKKYEFNSDYLNYKKENMIEDINIDLKTKNDKKA